MRLLHTLTAVILAVSTTLTVAPQRAEACGGGYGAFIAPAPRAHLVSTHTSMGKTRAFVALGASEVTEKEGEWTRLWPQSYDYTSIRTLESDYGQTFTLVGSNGRRIVRPNKRVLISGTFTLGNKTQEAREVGVKRSDDFEIALEGNHRDATWVELEDIGFKATPVFALHAQFELTRGETAFGTYSGYALGALQTGGRTYLVTRLDGVAALHAIL